MLLKVEKYQEEINSKLTFFFNGRDLIQVTQTPNHDAYLFFLILLKM